MNLDDSPHIADWLILVAFILASLALCMDAASAQDAQPIPSGEWSPAAHLLLTRAVVGESGWRDGEHVAISWALATRWDAMTRHGIMRSFVEHVYRYCQALRSSRGWLRALMLDGRVPKEVAAHAGHWERALATTASWARGERPRNCGMAEHWGGSSIKRDDTRAMKAVGDRRWYRIECDVKTENTFYGVRR